jgi:hypothetical protein
VWVLGKAMGVFRAFLSVGLGSVGEEENIYIHKWVHMW